jgi:hypothetical protein
MNYLPYIGFIIVLFLFSVLQMQGHLNERTNKLLNLLVILFYIVFFGLRGFVGYDTIMYYSFFQNLDTISYLNLHNQNFDLGFVIYASLIKTVFPNFHFLVLISVIIDVYLLHLFFKEYLPAKYYILGYIFFLGFYGYIYEIEQMRNIKSLLLFLLSIRHIENRNFLRFLILNLIGLTFHWSSFVFIPLYFFIHKKPFSLKIFFILFVIGNLVFLFKISYIKPLLGFIADLIGGTPRWKIHTYLNSDIYAVAYGFSFGYVERIFTACIVMLYYNKLINLDDNQKVKMHIFLNAYVFFILINLYFSEMLIVIERFAALFAFSYWILYPKIISIERLVQNIL